MSSKSSILINLDSNDKYKLQQLALQNKTSVNEIVRNLISEYILNTPLIDSEIEEFYNKNFKCISREDFINMLLKYGMENLKLSLNKGRRQGTYADAK